MKYEVIEKWLSYLDTYINPIAKRRLECDGMSRSVSMLLLRERIKHDMFVGAFYLKGEENIRGIIPLHYWIEINDHVCDFRVRMWINDSDAPHGIFVPNDKQKYVKKGKMIRPIDDVIFTTLTGMGIDQYPPLPGVHDDMRSV